MGQLIVLIADALKGIALLYIDTAPFIYFTEARDVNADKMHVVFANVSSGRIRVQTSAVTISETLMKPMQSNDTALVERYRRMFYRTRGIGVVAISPAAGDLSAQLRARYNLRTPDALHVACAIEARCNAFLTNDKGIKRVKELRVLVLDELELP